MRGRYLCLVLNNILLVRAVSGSVYMSGKVVDV